MSDNLKSKKVVLFGAGAMARDYSKVLTKLEIDFEVVGKSKSGVKKFFSDTGIEAVPGGVAGWKKNRDNDIKSAIVAVNLEELSQTAIDLMECGVRDILLEKPGGINLEEIKRVKNRADATGTKVWVAYNRRFYASVLKAQEVIIEDGGVQSFHFEFTEWSHVILDRVKSEVAKKNWFLANSSHVLDMAFMLGGVPREIESFTTGGCDWHPSAAIFTGSGVSKLGALFSYHANWLAPGRWSVEILTRHNRLVLMPLEKLKVQRKKSATVDFLDINDCLDRDFKPGLFKQTELFLKGANHKNFLRIGNHFENANLYFQRILHPH
ncbi:MAG: Gfo/Idh/MocA family oxidoreductase [Nitrospina sp.]|nr:Gfo/Idh/MocA family oxidoreductase [Nitrospina sp.]